MEVVCGYCGRHFDTCDKRVRYCSAECAKAYRNYKNAKGNQRRERYRRFEWAGNEATTLRMKMQSEGFDAVVEYVYKNYRRRA